MLSTQDKAAALEAVHQVVGQALDGTGKGIVVAGLVLGRVAAGDRLVVLVENVGAAVVHLLQDVSYLAAQLHALADHLFAITGAGFEPGVVFQQTFGNLIEPFGQFCRRPSVA
ncbi:MAG: hypothetical protein R2864_12840 [Syntrophotaleaceae bacterium]